MLRLERRSLPWKVSGLCDKAVGFGMYGMSYNPKLSFYATASEQLESSGTSEVSILGANRFCLVVTCVLATKYFAVIDSF